MNKKICRMCKGNKFTEVINFGRTPLVNSLLDEKDLSKTEHTYPLVVHRCSKCGLVQIVNNISAHKIYKDVDYLFFSSDMPTLSEYFKKYADEVTERFLKPNDLIVEIGSNDGVLLQHFPQVNRILGIDPATNVAIRAMKKGIPTLPLFWSERVAELIEREYGKAKVIAGNNCIAHLEDLHDLMRGVKKLLADDGVFIVECNYWGGMVKNKNYALIYQDHFSYFTLENWVNFLEEYDMEVFDAEITPAQGGSLRMFICKKGVQITSERLIVLAQEEKDTKLNSVETCNKYKEDIIAKAEKLREIIEELKMNGKKIAGYGAAAKGFSILHLAGIEKEHIDYFVDDSPAKQGKYTPITHIPIYSRKQVIDMLPDYFFILAPNYAKIIIEKEQNFLDKGGKFLLESGEIIG